MGDFTPGVERAKAAGHAIEVRPYPSGVAGVRLSLDVVAKKIRDGRLDPDVRGWAGDVLIAAGKPTRIRDQAQALLDAFRKQTMYLSDPVGAEYIAPGSTTLCLRPGLCVRARDCDDGVVALGSALLSVGIPVKVIKQNFGPGKQEHVLVVAQDESGAWLAVDPSTSLPVGSRVPAVREEVIDPMDVVGSAGTSGAEIVTLGKVSLQGRDVHWDGHTWRERRYGREFRWSGVGGWVEEAPKSAGLGHAPGKPCCDACAKAGAGKVEDDGAPCSACELYARRHGLMGPLQAALPRKFGPLRLPGFGALGDSTQNLATLNDARTTFAAGDAYLRTGDFASAVESYKTAGQQVIDLPGYNADDGQALANAPLTGINASQASSARSSAAHLLSSVAAVVDPSAPAFGIGELALVAAGLALVGGIVWYVKSEHAQPRLHALAEAREYVAVDMRGRKVAGPFPDYAQAKRHADRAGGYVKWSEAA